MVKKGKARASGPPTILNRRARFDYEILETYEAGIVLVGAEVKSVLAGKVNLSGAHAQVRGGEVWLEEMDVAPYEKATSYIPDRQRPRKLLLHRREIALLRRRSEERGLALIPTKVYFRNGRVKVEIAVARGKKHYDKRRSLADKDLRRELERKQ